MNEITSFDGEFRFLSNFHYVPHLGTTAEHLYQAAKAADPIDMIRILAAETPGQAKRLGARCKMRENWDHIKIGVMREVIAQKFEDPELRDFLLSTGEARLIEGNTWGDTFWGVCGGVGLNNLGLLLMERRQQLRDAL